MLYQLPNGKVVEISLEDFLEMTDADFQNLMAFNVGEHTNNPWLDSALIEDDESDDEEIVKELPEVDDLEKLDNQDFEIEEE